MTPSSRDTDSRSSPRSRRSTVSRLRRAENRPPRPRPAGPSGRPPGFLRRRRAGLDPDAARLAQSEVRQGLDVEHDAVRVPAHWHAAGLRGDERRRDRDAAARLACPPGDGAAGARTHQHGDGMGRGDGPESRQPMRPHRAGPGPAAESGPAHAGAAPSRRGGGHRRGAGGGGSARGDARLRVPRAHGGAIR